MARGTPDGGYQSYSSAVNQSDLGSVADRLLMGGGSQSKTGRVLWATGFEGITSGQTPLDISGYLGAAGTGIIATDNTSPVYQGLNSLKITTPPVINDVVQVYKLLPWQTSKTALELYALITFPTTSYDLVIEITKLGLENNKYNMGRLVISIIDNTPTVRLYRDNNGIRTLIQDISGLFIGFNTYHFIKFIFDANNNLYADAFFDHLRFDLSNIAGFQGSTGNYGMRFLVNLITTTSGAAHVNIDNIILTADEP